MIVRASVRWSLVVAVCTAPPLIAQEPASTPPGVVAPSPATDSLAPLALARDVALRAGISTYRLSLVRDGGPTSLGARTVDVRETTIGGTAAWLIAEQRTGTAVPTVDSLWLARADLAPIRWVGVIDRTQLAASFNRDSVFGAVQSYAGRFSFGAPVMPGVLVTPGMTERVIEQLPLAVGYRAAGSLLLVDMGTPRGLPVELFVEREERIRLPSGDVDCWVAVLHAGAMEQRLWVDRARRVVVRTEQTGAAGKVIAEL